MKKKDKKLKKNKKIEEKTRVAELTNDWGAIFMKLSYEDKIQIYDLRQK